MTMDTTTQLNFSRKSNSKAFVEQNIHKITITFKPVKLIQWNEHYFIIHLFKDDKT